MVNRENVYILSLDNYSSGKKNNHIRSKNVKYIKGDIRDINNILKKYKKKINTVFHFGEFSRIYQSFKKFNVCFETNLIGTKEVLAFALRIK